MMINIQLNAPVYCEDDFAGHVTGLILNPHTDLLTHIVVDVNGTERLIPIYKVRPFTGNSLIVMYTWLELREAEPFVEQEYVRSPIEFYDPVVMLGEMEVIPMHKTVEVEVKHRHIPAGEQEIVRGLPVFAKDGFVGKLDSVSVDSENHRVTAVVVRQSELWRHHDTRIETEHIKSIEDDGIYLRLNRDQVRQLPG